jgi:hypothetical protein
VTDLLFFPEGNYLNSNRKNAIPLKEEENPSAICKQGSVVDRAAGSSVDHLCERFGDIIV